jgi:HK97 family phage portal protein
MVWYAPWRKKVVEEKSMVLGTSKALGDFLTFGEPGNAATPTSALNLFEQSSAVSIPVGMIADNFAVLEPIVLDGDKRVKSHPVIDLLAIPSPYFTREHLFEFLAKEYLVTGECSYVTLGRINREPLEVQPLSVRNLTLSEGVGGVPQQIHVSGNTLTGTYMPLVKNSVLRYLHDSSLRELTQIRNYSTKNNSLLRGQSPLLAASKEVRQHILGGSHNVSILRKGGRVSLVFHFNADMDDEDFEDAKKRVREQYGGANVAGEIGVTAGGEMSIKEVGVNNRDMDFANLQKMAVKAITLQYHVPLPLVTDERQTLNNYREGKLALYDDAIIPLSRRIFGGLTNTLMPRYGQDPKRFRITYDPDQVSALVQRRNEELGKRSRIGVETDNEIRALMGREPYEGGDVILKPASLIPAGTDVFSSDNDPEILEDVNA